jgi:muconolactone D-isomerase
MLFHVHMTVHVPHDLDPDQVSLLNDEEHKVARALQLDGRWLHLWRVAGKYENVSIFEVADPGELHDIVSSLPLYPFMDVTVTALSRHPGAISEEQPGPA